MRGVMPRTEWPTTLYDYELNVIVDVAVEELDLEQGCWVRCNRCGNTLKMSIPFGEKSWKAHKTTKKHNNYENAVQRGIQMSQGLLPSSQMELTPQWHSQSVETTSDYNPVDFTSVLLHEARNDSEFLSLCHRGITQTKQHESQHEREVKRVINAMTDLITEQQQDLEALQHQVNTMEKAMESFTTDMGLLRCNYLPTHDSWSSPHKDGASAMAYERRIVPYGSTWGFREGLPNPIDVVNYSDDADTDGTMMDTQVFEIIDLAMKRD